MIFVTVGTQLPFDRLIGAVDAWASSRPGVEVFAQIGRGGLQPRHIPFAHELSPAEFRARVEACHTVVAHAGMGSIITAIELGRRVIVMPRRAALGEHRNDHQLATVARLAHLRGLEVADEPQVLVHLLERGGDYLQGGAPAESANPLLIQAVREFAGLVAA